MASNNFKNLLSSIDALNDKSSVNVYVPSIDKEIPFAPMSVKQQKDLMSSGVDTNVENLSFMNMINTIIKDNCKHPGVKVLLCDKPIVILQLRLNAVGSDLKIEHEQQTYSIDLKEHIDDILNRYKITSKTFEVEHDTIKITGRIPDIDIDTKYNHVFTNTVKKDNKTKVKITDIVGNIYVSELVKYIDTVSIEDNHVSLEDGVSPGDMIKIFESLPLQVSNKLANEVKKMREYENNCLNPQGTPAEASISIDAGLFTTSE